MFNYFCHPSCLSTMEDVLKMRMSEGSAGFGIYVMILEQLRNAPEYSVKFEPDVLAWSLHEPDVERLRRVVLDYGLFVMSDDGSFTSPWLCSAMAEHDNKRAKLSAAGKKSAAMRQGGSNLAATTLTDEQQPGCNQVDQNSQQINKKINKKTKKEPIPTTSGNGVDVDIFSDDFISRVGKEGGELYNPDKHAQGVENDGQHNYNVLIAAAVTYRLTVNQFNVMMVAVDGCTIGAPRFVAFIATLRHCRETNFKPTYPFEYFMSKLKTVA